MSEDDLMNMRRAIAVAAFLLVATPGVAQNKPDWITVTNQDCRVWNPNPIPNESVTWSGGCTDGLASGMGLLRWMVDGKLDVEFEGRYANGKRNGHGVLKTADGQRIEGDWLNDELLDKDSPPI
jgi:MORN repeat